MTSTPERLRAAALDLFAKKGFRGTTVGEIEAAAGLAPRAGSFYRHYASKEEVFKDCIETFVEEVFAELSFSDMLPLGDVRAELLIIGRTLLRLATRHRKIRVLLRSEGRRYPQVASRMAEINRRFGEQSLTPWLETTYGPYVHAGESLESLALMIFGPVLYYMLESDLDQHAFGLTEEVLLTSWADFWAAELSRRLESTTAETSVTEDQ